MTGFTLLRRMHPLRRDNKGMAVVELGLVMPVLMFLLMGAIDMSRFITGRMDLEKAAQPAVLERRSPSGQGACGQIRIEEGQGQVREDDGDAD